eukprot:s6815_g5.t4
MLSSFGGSHKKFELPPVDSRWSIQLMRCGPSPALQEIARAAPWWVLCYDIVHAADKDLLSFEVQIGSEFLAFLVNLVREAETEASHATAASRRVAEKGAAGAALKRTAWEMLTRWERLEPTKHRPPLPETVFEELGFSTLRLDSAGFCAASFSAPADALMTEYQSSSDGGLLRSAGNMLRKRGPAAFVRGWTANFCRHPCLMKPKVTRGSAF